jgi:hypothetical protein
LLVASTLAIGSPATPTENCTVIGGLARKIMEARQNGVDMSAVMSGFDKVDGDPDFKILAKDVVIQAYATPLFNGEEYQQRTISEFSNEMQLKCYQTYSQQ